MTTTAPLTAQETARPAQLTDMATYRITMVEQALNRADLLDEEVRARLLRHCPRHDLAEVEHVMALHEELLSFLPPDAVPSTDEQSEYEALAYDLYASIKALVSGR